MFDINRNFTDVNPACQQLVPSKVRAYSFFISRLYWGK